VIAVAFALRDKTRAIYVHQTTKTTPEDGLQGWLMDVLVGAVVET